MSAGLLLGIGILGGLGALARVALDAAVEVRAGSAFPWGVLAVNVSGSFGLGVVTGLALGDSAHDLLAVGLLGAFTTFSTWMFETQRILTGHRPWRGLANVLLSLALGLAAVWLGRELGLAL
jgi:CrcB protein